MKKIVLSLGLVGIAVSVLAFGSTGAFFSDTEASANNIFTAGSIDLKIDHSLATYNGNNIGGDLTIVSDADTTTDLPGPAVVLSFVHPLWASITGSPLPKWIWATDGPTNPEIDQTYTFTRTFDWNGPVASATLDMAVDNAYTVTLNGNPVAADPTEFNYGSVTHFDITPYIVQNTNTLVFTVKNIGVPGDSPTDNPAGLLFRLIINGQELFLDPVDLNGRPFWNFNDVKPQDQGRDVFSLHVDTNDAWTCLQIKNVKNDENTLVAPEVAAGDVTPGLAGVGGGELGNYLNLFLWHDTNANGVYEPGSGETALSQGLFGSGLNLAIHDSTTGSGPQSGGSTDEVGAAWCAGTQTVDNGTGVITCDGTTMGNDAQTDSLTADLSFYATQSRNQPDFKCSDIPNS